jgi:hypothetical protein
MQSEAKEPGRIGSALTAGLAACGDNFDIAYRHLLSGIRILRKYSSNERGIARRIDAQGEHNTNGDNSEDENGGSCYGCSMPSGQIVPPVKFYDACGKKSLSLSLPKGRKRHLVRCCHIKVGYFYESDLTIG